MVSTAPTNKGTELEGLLRVNLASKMAAKLSFQSRVHWVLAITRVSVTWSINKYNVTTCSRLLNNVLPSTLFNLVNNIVQHFKAWISPQSGVKILNKILDNIEQSHSKTLFNAVFINPEQVVHFLLCKKQLRLHFSRFLPAQAAAHMCTTPHWLKKQQNISTAISTSRIITITIAAIAPPLSPLLRATFPGGSATKKIFWVGFWEGC